MAIAPPKRHAKGSVEERKESTRVLQRCVVTARLFVLGARCGSTGGCSLKKMVDPVGPVHGDVADAVAHEKLIVLKGRRGSSSIMAALHTASASSSVAQVCAAPCARPRALHAAARGDGAICT